MNNDKEFKCMLSKVESIEDWINRGDKDGNCPPCLIKPLASYYVGVLEEARLQDKAENLKSVFEGGDILTIAQTMDKIRSEVESELKEKLRDFDCMAQSFKE
jgi:hypothetical protein